MLLDDITTSGSTYQNMLDSFKNKIVSADEAVKAVKSHDNILVHSNCAIPSGIIDALMKRKDELEGVNIYHALAVGDLDYLKPGMEKHFRHKAFFIGPNARKAVAEGRADFIPIFLADIPRLFKKNIIPVDVAMIHVSPPDKQGFCSLGIEVGLTKTGTESAKIVIAQINKNMPRVLGDSFIHISKIDYLVDIEEPIKELPQSMDNLPEDQLNVFTSIGKHIADIIEDGSNLQLGIGAIPDSILKFLNGRKNLGIHTELFSDGVINLIEKGIINNENKTIHKGKVIAGFVLGTRRLYDFIDNNPVFEFHRTEYVNDPYIIAKNPKMVAVNSAIEIDITGQVCADSIGTRFYSGFGGQLDFIRGAARSEGGKPIIALPSTTKNETISRIVPQLKPGAGVVTGRADVHYVVTEYGTAQLFGKSVNERVKALIEVAHPKFREELYKYASEQKYI